MRITIASQTISTRIALICVGLSCATVGYSQAHSKEERAAEYARVQALCAPNYELANQYFDGGSYALCLAELNKVRTKYEGSYITYPGDNKMRLRCHFYLGQWMEVIQYDVSPLKVDQDVYPLFALTYLELNDINRSRSIYNRSSNRGRYSQQLRSELSATPSALELRFWAHTQLGIDFLSHGGKNVSKGLGELILANRILPENPTCLWVQAKCYLNLKKPQHAKAIFQKLTRTQNSYTDLAKSELPSCERAIAKASSASSGKVP